MGHLQLVNIFTNNIELLSPFQRKKIKFRFYFEFLWHFILREDNDVYEMFSTLKSKSKMQ